MKTVVVSGGFDPVHIGHLKLFEEAKKLGEHLIVIVNSDKFLKEKKIDIRNTNKINFIEQTIQKFRS